MTDLSKWRPIETAPRDGTWVLLWGRDLHFPGMVDIEMWMAMWNEDSNGWMDQDQFVMTEDTATHWMPLPEPPMGAEK